VRLTKSSTYIKHHQQQVCILMYGQTPAERPSIPGRITL